MYVCRNQPNLLNPILNLLSRLSLSYMSIRIFFILLLALVLSRSELNSQPTLPQFAVTKLSDDRVLIQWKNPDSTLRQISIQQSADSGKGFRTLLTMPDPSTPENGTVINRTGAGQMFYRLYLMYPRGRFLFTKVLVPGSAPKPTVKPVSIEQSSTETPLPSPINKPTPYVPGRSATATVPPIEHLVKPDSVARVKPYLNKLPRLSPGEGIKVKKQKAPPTEPLQYTPSLTIFTHRDGYVFIQLPTTLNLGNTQVRFFTEDGQALFELNQPPIRVFRIDKTNFYRTGWYRFEIWQKGKMIETNRFFLPLEF